MSRLIWRPFRRRHPRDEGAGVGPASQPWPWMAKWKGLGALCRAAGGWAMVQPYFSRRFLCSGWTIRVPATKRKGGRFRLLLQIEYRRRALIVARNPPSTTVYPCPKAGLSASVLEVAISGPGVTDVTTQVQGKRQLRKRLGSDKMWRARTRDGNRGSLKEAAGATPPARPSVIRTSSLSFRKVGWYLALRMRRARARERERDVGGRRPAGLPIDANPPCPSSFALYRRAGKGLPCRTHPSLALSPSHTLGFDCMHAIHSWMGRCM